MSDLAGIERVHGPALPSRTALDLGPHWRRGIVTYPVRHGASFETMVSAVDGDGNEVAGVRVPELVAPLATYTPWPLVEVGDDDTQGSVSLVGTMLPFPWTPHERELRGDPRQSIEERYSSLDEYLSRVDAAATDLVAKGFLLTDDIETVIAGARRTYEAIQVQVR